VKPANIFLSAEGNVKLGDFGLARDIILASPSDMGSSQPFGDLGGSNGLSLAAFGTSNDSAPPKPSLHRSNSSSEHTSGLGTATYAAYFPILLTSFIAFNLISVGLSSCKQRIILSKSIFIR
jgi:serine/threonine protein kinase